MHDPMQWWAWQSMNASWRCVPAADAARCAIAGLTVMLDDGGSLPDLTPEKYRQWRPMRVVRRPTLICPQPKAYDDGKRLYLCRWCHGPVPEGRRSWCCPQHEDSYVVGMSSGSARLMVRRRDSATCARCGVDVAEARSWWDRIRAAGRRARDERGPTDAQVWVAAAREVGWPGPGRDWWDADHIVPLAEGGALTLDNLRTLCVPCHKEETAALARRLAEKRRDVPRGFYAEVSDGA